MRKPKNKGRKQKKQQKKFYALGDGKRLLFSYSENRKICRQSHETSIALSREGHWNYWDIWTTTDETGHRHFHGHAAESVRLAKPVLSRLDTTEDEVKLILDLIEHHDMQLASTTKAVRRVKNKYGADFIRKWAILRQADRDDYIYPKGKNTQFYTDIEGILATLALLEYNEVAEARTFKPSDLAINGNDLIQELGFKEGPVIGTVLHKLFEEVKAGKIKNAKRELLDESLCIFMKLPKDDAQKYFTSDIHIEEKDVIRTCSVCHKSYKDKQVYVNGVSSYSFALCSNCRKSYIFKFEDSER